MELDQSLLSTLPDFLTPDMLSSVLPIFRSTLYRALHQGTIRYLRIGKPFIVSRTHLERWLRQFVSERGAWLMVCRLKGDGSLHQTEDKIWVCQYYGDNGKRHMKRFQRKVDGQAFLDGLRRAEPAATLPEQPTTETSTSVRTVSTTKKDHSMRIVYLCDELHPELCQCREIQFSLEDEPCDPLQAAGTRQCLPYHGTVRVLL